MTFVWNIVFDVSFCFLRFKEIFSLMLTMSYSNQWNYTFVSKTETFIFFSLSDPSRIKKLCEWAWLFRGNIVICISSIRTYSPYNRIHWLYYQGFDWNVIFETYRLRYDNTAFQEQRLDILEYSHLETWAWYLVYRDSGNLIR